MSKPKASSAKGVRALLKKGKRDNYSAGNGLYLATNGEGGGSWLFRYQINGKREWMGLGSTDGISLADARAIVAEQKTLVAKGINPREYREQKRQEAKAAAVTFDEVAKEYIDAKRPEWSKNNTRSWENTLATHASPIIGHLPPAEITTEHVLEVMRPLWHTKYDTARRVRNRIEKVLNVAKVRKLREGENVAAWRGHLELLLPTNKRNTRRMPALPYEQAPDIWVELMKLNTPASQALMLVMLTGVRSSEARLATWNEFDFEKKVWTIPEGRMKKNKEHRVPLSDAAIALVMRQPKLTSNLVFEGAKEGAPFSNTGMVETIQMLDEQDIKNGGKGWRNDKNEVVVPHGFRSTLRDWIAEETATPNHVAEQVLAHAIGDDVEAAYRRGDLFKKRREVMELWSHYLTGGNNGR